MPVHFYDPSAEPHGLPHDPIKSCVVPRPIGWISTLATDGTPNLAPYSFFNLVADSPHQCMFASSGRRDSASNAIETGEFVFNIATEALVEPMNRSAIAFDASVDEFEAAGLTKLASVNVAPPRVAESPIHLECKVDQVVRLRADGAGRHNDLIIGLIVGAHIDDAYMSEGMIDIAKLRPISRLGYRQYATIGDDLFNLTRPRNLDDAQAVEKL